MMQLVSEIKIGAILFLIIRIILKIDKYTVPGEPEKSSHFTRFIAPWVHHKFE